MAAVDSRLFSVMHRTKGRALRVCPDGILYRSLHFNIYQSVDEGESWEKILTIPRPWRWALAEPFRLLVRLLRHEVRALLVLNDGGHVATTRKGIFWAAPGQRVMTPAEVDGGDLPVRYPMCLALIPDGRVIWGEYGTETNPPSRRLFVSEDGGRSYGVAHAFAAGECGHIHNVFYDSTLDKLWVFVGDHGDHPGMGLLETDFSSFQWVFKGQQKYRAVCAFDFGDRLVYATDTNAEQNAIYSLDKNTMRVTHVTDIDGSCIYACRCGGCCVLSTTAEPARTNIDLAASLWISLDGDRWKRLFTHCKDRWSYTYFQFGSPVLPRGRSDRNVLMFSGQALKGIDGKLFVARLTADGA